jgi:hypothetical protein
LRRVGASQWYASMADLPFPITEGTLTGPSRTSGSVPYRSVLTAGALWTAQFNRWLHDHPVVHVAFRDALA